MQRVAAADRAEGGGRSGDPRSRRRRGLLKSGAWMRWAAAAVAAGGGMWAEAAGDGRRLGVGSGVSGKVGGGYQCLNPNARSWPSRARAPIDERDAIFFL
jgi:hypothetical protein